MTVSVFALIGALIGLGVERWSRRLHATMVVPLHPLWLILAGALGCAFIPLQLNSSEWLVALGVGVSVLYICACDLRARLIPNRAVLSLAVLALVRAVALNALPSSVSGGLFAFALFVLIARLLGQLGAGDMKLAMVIGLFVGWPDVMSALYWGMLIGAMTTLTLLLLKLKKRNELVAYGPYLCLGVWLCWLFGL